MKKLLPILIVLIAISSISYYFYQDRRQKLIEKCLSEWENVSTEPTIPSLLQFIENYSKCEKAPIAQIMLDSLQMEEMWIETKKQNTIQAFLDFEDKYPDSKYQKELKKNIYELKMEKAWGDALSLNTKSGYKKFREDFPNSPYDDKAKTKIIDLVWKDALAKNTKTDYEQFRREYPNSPYDGKAITKIVDIIFAGQYGDKPPDEPVRIDKSSKVSTINIKNDTEYTLTILYSGKQSKEIKIIPNGSSSITFRIGHYRIAAFVSSPNVIPYAGVQDYLGGVYSSRFYISIL